MADVIPSKSNILIAYYENSRRIQPLIYGSETYEKLGQLDAAITSKAELISVLQRQLELEALNNKYYPDSPFDSRPTVNILVDTMLRQADILEASGDRNQSEKIRAEAMQLSDKYLSPTDRAERQRQRAASFILQGRFNEALVTLISVRNIFQKGNDLLNMARVTADIAGVLEWLEDYDRALAEVNKSTDSIVPLIPGRKPSESDILFSIRSGQFENGLQDAKLLGIYLELAQIRARINRYKGNLKEAELQFIEILPKVPASVQFGIEFHLAAIFIQSGRYAEGLGYLTKLETAFEGLARPKLGILLSWKAEALLGLGKLDEALKNIDHGIQELSHYQDFDALWRAQWRLARILTAQHQVINSLKAYSQAADTINTLRKAPLGYRLDSTYLRDKVPVFEAAIDLASELREAETCCRLMEMIKSRTLTATLGITTPAQIQQASDLDQRFDNISRQIDALEYKSYGSEDSQEIDRERVALLSTRADLVEQIRYSDPRWRSLTEPLPFDLPGVLNLLEQRKQAALTLFYQPHQVIGVMLKDKKCSVSKVQIPSETGVTLTNYQLNLQSNKPNQSWFDPSIGLNLDAEQLAPAELLESALQATSLVIVPHGSLHLIPWAGLLFRGKRLFQYCPVGIIPNLSCLLSLKTSFSAAPRVGLIGAPDYSSWPKLKPLYMAPIELQTIKDIYSSGAGIIDDIVMDARATEANFWQLAKHQDSSRNILHISSHGNFVTGDPMNAGLLMAGRKVDAAEIARAKLRYDEVVLSACSTGFRPTEVQGITLTGDDILGLPGAFLEAGVRSVLVSIAPAREDVMLRFMTIYHENRAIGKTPMAALRETQNTMISSSPYEPYLWIGITVYGCQ